MSTNTRSYITTLGECMQAMSPFAGGAVPASNSADYANWIRWIQGAQEDCAKRAFWSRLLARTTVTWDAGDENFDLPANFHKRNGIYVFNVGTEDWNQPDNASGQRLMVTVDSTTGAWKGWFTGFIPTSAGSATMWYFFNPPKPEGETDPLFLDGDMILFGALKEHFRKARQPGSQDDARIEYENRLKENLNLDNLPSPQELCSWSKPSQFHVNERRFYYTNRGRGGY